MELTYLRLNNFLNTDIYILSNEEQKNANWLSSLIFTSVQSNLHYYNTFLDNKMPAMLIFGACGSKHYSQFI